MVLRFCVFFVLKSANYLIRSSLFKRDDGHRSPEPSTYLALDCYSHPCILQSTLYIGAEQFIHMYKKSPYQESTLLRLYAKLYLPSTLNIDLVL